MTRRLNIVRHQGMQALPAAYEKLFSASGRQSLFLSSDWFVNFEKTVLAGEEKAEVFGVEDEAHSPIAALVMRLAREGERPWSPVRLEALGNYYTSLHGVVGTVDAKDLEPVRTLAKALRKDSRRWDVLDLQPLDANGQLFLALPEILKREGFFVQTYYCFGNWYLEVNGRTYAEYFSGLSSSLRKNIPYYTRKLQRSPRSRIEIIEGGERLEQVLLDYEKVYGSSWKVAEPYPSFIPGLVRMAARNGWLRFGVVYVEDEPAAAQIWFVVDGVASIYKVAYDARFGKLSVGTILTAAMMERVIDVDHAGVVDYLTGDDDYKKDWMSHRRERWGIVAFNPRRVRGALQAIRHIAGRTLKRLRALARSARGKQVPAPAPPDEKAEKISK